MYDVHPLLYLSGALQDVKVLPRPPVPGRSVVHADTFVELMEKERKGRDQSGEWGNKSGMRSEREAEEGQPIGETVFFLSVWSVFSHHIAMSCYVHWN